MDDEKKALRLREAEEREAAEKSLRLRQPLAPLAPTPRPAVVRAGIPLPAGSENNGEVDGSDEDEGETGDVSDEGEDLVREARSSQSQAPKKPRKRLAAGRKLRLRP